MAFRNIVELIKGEKVQKKVLWRCLKARVVLVAYIRAIKDIVK